jgi:hypothetical protein
LQGPPRFMAENTVTDLPDPDFSLPVQPQAPRANVQQARLQQWQRLQAAQEQVNSIYQPPASNIMGGRLRPAFEEVDVRAMLRQANDDELRRLQLEQARLEQRKNRHIEQGYVSNRPKPLTSEEARIKFEAGGGATDITAETYFDVISWFYGAKEALEIIKLLKQLRIPLRLFMQWLKEEIKRKRLKESLEELARASKNSGFKLGAGGAKGVVEKTIRGVRVKFEANQVKQKIMSHFRDFDWPKPYRDKDIEEILNHLVNKMTHADLAIKGTWRKKPCIHFYDTKTGVVYIVLENGNMFETFFKLAPKQLEWLLKTGDIR